MVSLELDEGNKMDNICQALIKYTLHICYKKVTIKIFIPRLYLRQWYRKWMIGPNNFA